MSEELMHYGVLGMKWGVIRTPEQLGHKPNEKSTPSEMTEQKRSDKNKTKNVSDMTDEELRERIQRMDMEERELRQRIQRLNMEEQYETLAAKAKDRNMSALQKAAYSALEQLGQQSFDVALRYVKAKISSKEDPDVLKWKDADITTMDAETIAAVANYYKNAKIVTSIRRELGGGS